MSDDLKKFDEYDWEYNSEEEEESKKEIISKINQTNNIIEIDSKISYNNESIGYQAKLGKETQNKTRNSGEYYEDKNVLIGCNIKNKSKFETQKCFKNKLEKKENETNEMDYFKSVDKFKYCNELDDLKNKSLCKVAENNHKQNNFSSFKPEKQKINNLPSSSREIIFVYNSNQHKSNSKSINKEDSFKQDFFAKKSLNMKQKNKNFDFKDDKKKFDNKIFVENQTHKIKYQYSQNEDYYYKKSLENN